MLQTKTEISKVREHWAFPFFSLLTCQAFTLLGGQLTRFVLIWYLTKTTGSASVLTFALLVYLLPQMILGPIAGVVIDRRSRKIVLIAADFFLALATLGMGSLFGFGIISNSIIFLWIFILGLADGFINPAMLATTTLMVPVQHLTRIQGINQTLQGGLSIIYAPLGAILYQSLSMQWLLVFCSFPALIALICLLFIEIPQPLTHRLVERRMIQDILLGLHCIFDQTGLGILIGIAMILNCLAAIAQALIPLLVSKYYHGDALQLGWMNSTLGIGVILGGLILSIWGGTQRKMVTTLLGICGIGIGTTLMGIARSHARISTPGA